MADIFISYKSERRPAASHIADILTAHGYSVWFDYDLVPGKNFGMHIERELRAAKAVLVLWCQRSVGSEWVREEAALAKSLGTFVPVRIEVCDPPLGFLLADYVDIADWDGDPSTRSLDRLIDRLEQLIGREATIARRQLIELHQTWQRHGRPTLAQFALKKARDDITASDRRLPSATAGAGSTDARDDATPLAAAERDWQAHDLDRTTDVGLLEAFAAQYARTAPLLAYRAKQRLAALPAPLTDCDRLAASPYDENARALGVPGVEVDRIDAAKAVPACREALARYPNESRFVFQLGRALERNGKNVEAAECFREAAEAGNSLGMHNLGGMYGAGCGVNQDDSEAVKWYRKAAEAGNSGSMHNLGWMYDKGRGVGNDPVKAARWIEAALRAGNDISLQKMKNNSNRWSQDFRRALQQRLKDSGHYRGPVDGDFGPVMIQAIEAIFGTGKKS